MRHFHYDESPKRYYGSSMDLESVVMAAHALMAVLTPMGSGSYSK
jgi:hypothetical protein